MASYFTFLFFLRGNTIVLPALVQWGLRTDSIFLQTWHFVRSLLYFCQRRRQIDGIDRAARPIIQFLTINFVIDRIRLRRRMFVSPWWSCISKGTRWRAGRSYSILRRVSYANKVDKKIARSSLLSGKKTRPIFRVSILFRLGQSCCIVIVRLVVSIALRYADGPGRISSEIFHRFSSFSTTRVMHLFLVPLLI